MLERAAILLGQEVHAVTQLSGGDLSFVIRLALHDGSSAIAKFGALAMQEAAMLEALRYQGVPTPRVYAVEADLLIMEDLGVGSALGRTWPHLAEILDVLHMPHAGQFGWHCDYAFGSLPIANQWHGSWVDFWADHRLRCHLRHIDGRLAGRLEQLIDRLGELLPDRPQVSLLHGDLWGGNVLAQGDQVVGLIDPACYYGDREVDFAMLSVFDRPPVAFYDACALPEGWQRRQPVYRLWPLLVHLRLFGEGHASQVRDCIAELGF